jgi:hypothetical protein
MRQQRGVLFALDMHMRRNAARTACPHLDGKQPGVSFTVYMSAVLILEQLFLRSCLDGFEFNDKE